MAEQQSPSITVEGVEFSWDFERGLMLCWGQPVVLMWTESTMAGFMSGLQRILGTERFNLALEGSGRESTEGEWRDIIQRMPTVEEGLSFVGRAMRTVGLGEFELIELDREARRIRFRVTQSWEGIYQRALGVDWGTWSIAGKLAGYSERILGVPCQVVQTSFTARGDAFDEFEVTPTEQTYAARVAAIVDTEAATREDLREALARVRDEVRERQRVEARLRDEITERQRVEDELRAKLELIERQEQAISELSTPILQVWPGIVALPIVGPVDGERVARMTESLLARISQTHARHVILDLTGADALDEAAAANLLRIVSAARLLGAACLLSGISPRMSATLVAIDAPLAGVSAFGTLEAALQAAIRNLG
ncbi:STAS domain-containing protein [Nannocystis pusilla]|uniref:STAS domain-containing protein n=1 Tax=Nannocystis pusilla TaxID=889268 RepID=A0ABS7U403_9BACT|nr:STAS domain-containing protein [Nannocystis pusilla]MBZ5715149.1 STAS domain-containing protein [Nannocystis pusilla]